MAEHNELGKKGEQLAIDFLLKNDYRILEKNYRYLKAEIDIIAQKEEIIIAVEVKTRTSNYFGNPQDFVNPKKIKLLVSAMDYYVVHNNLDVEVRFDIIAITTNTKSTKTEHIEDAFLYF
jgi:putative endonuclease